MCCITEGAWSPPPEGTGPLRSSSYDAPAYPAAQVFDRMSKGVREAPSKALIGELAAQSGDRPEQAFGESLSCRPWSRPAASLRLRSLVLARCSAFVGYRCLADDQ